MEYIERRERGKRVEWGTTNDGGNKREKTNEL